MIPTGYKPTGFEVIDTMNWSEPKLVSTRRGNRLLSTCPPDSLFWGEWKRSKDQLQKLGISCTNQGGWVACWWNEAAEQEPAPKPVTKAELSRAEDSSFHVPTPPGKELRGYQRAGVCYAVSCHRSGVGCLIGDEMGLGKTSQAIGFINAQEWVERVLIVCPKSLKRNWYLELRSWLTRELSIGIQEPGMPWAGNEHAIVVCNFDIIGRYPEAQETLWDLRVVDEAHYLSSKSAKRTKVTLATQARMKLHLTGTAAENGKHAELWTLISDLDPERWDPKKGWWSYGHRYCGPRQIKVKIWDKKLGKKVERKITTFDGSTNAKELQQILRSTIMIRRRKEDVLKELPEVVQQIIELPADGVKELIRKEQTAVAKSFEAHADAMPEGEVASFETMSIQRLELGLAKVPLAIEFVDDVLAEDPQRKVIVFGHHEAVMQQFKAHWPKAAMIIGSTPWGQRQAQVERFQTNPECRVILGNDAMKEGLNLQAAEQVIFAEGSWVPGNLAQKIARAARMGQTKSVLVTHLVWEGSLDSRMIRRTVQKMGKINRVLDDK